MRSLRSCPSVLAITAAILPFSGALELDVGSKDSITGAAAVVASNLLDVYYGSGSIPGIFPDPYSDYWWEGGAAWDGLINYWYLTGNDTYNDLVRSALLWQTGPDDNFMPPNQSLQLSNDAQSFWALAAMTAAERDFPAKAGQTAWIDLAKNVFDVISARWDEDSCGGGFRWQIFTFLDGYDYKNAASQALFFQLAARLAHFTGNQTYTEWAVKSHNWTLSIGLTTDDFKVYDGTDTASNCSSTSHVQWSYDYAAFIYGSAVLYNVTGDDTWKTRTNGYLSAFSDTFFSENATDVLYEPMCDPSDTCNIGEAAYKALTVRWLAGTAQVAPWTSDSILPKLRASAKAAAAHCSEDDSGSTLCTSSWYDSRLNASTGLGEQLSALDVIQATLISDAAALETADGANGTTSTNSSSTSGGAAASTSTRAASAAPESVVRQAWVPLVVLAIAVLHLCYL